MTDVESPIDLIIPTRPRDIGGFSVRRSLPVAARRLVGPFIFFDHMGPAELAPGEGVDTPPHPHIGLATITYLFDGALVHRDSVGSEQRIEPGDVNWMIAGKGIAHSERTPPELRERGARLHGLQTWVALPRDREDAEPTFEHHPSATLPLVRRPGAELRVIAGTAYGQRAPTRVLLPTLYVHARLDAGATLEVDDEHAERAIYVVDGSIELAGQTFGEAQMIVLRPGARAELRALTAANVMLVGGAPIDGPRHIWWNFVATSRERIEEAKSAWREGRFAKVFHDETEFVPLPER